MPKPLTLAQLANWINPPIPPLPEPPLFQRLVLENPAIPAAALLLAGVIVLIAMRSRARLRAGLIFFATAAALATGIWTTGSLVRTDRETLLDLQDQLIEATTRARTDELDTLLARDARVGPTRLPMLQSGLDRPAILSTVRAVLDGSHPLADNAIIERQAVIDGPNSARTQVYLSVQPEDYNKVWSWFAIAWRLEPDGQWRAIEIQPLFISGILPYGS